MSNIKVKRESIYLNNVKGDLVRFYELRWNALGGQDWHLFKVEFQKTQNNETAIRKYSIQDKQCCYVNGVSCTKFNVFEEFDDRYVFVGVSFAKSRGVARNSTCLKAWLSNEQ